MKGEGNASQAVIAEASNKGSCEVFSRGLIDKQAWRQPRMDGSAAITELAAGRHTLREL